ncbi:unnamed protein product, partial [Nesidiocoris tenuis]
MFFSIFQMDSSSLLLQKIQKSAAVIELRSLDSLQLETPYMVMKLVWTDTKFGPAVQAHLQELTDGQRLGGGDTFRVFLPRRIGQNLSEAE